MLFYLSVLLCILSMSQATSDTLSPRNYRTKAASSVGLSPGDRFYGKGTWYLPGLGACGSHATGTDYIVAINKSQYQGRMCHKHVRIVNTTNGKSVQAQIQDKCPSCDYGSLDMSPAVFTAISDSGLGEGKLEISWSYSSSHSHSQSESRPHHYSHHSHHSYSHSHTYSHSHPHTHGHKYRHKHKHRHDQWDPHRRPDCEPRGPDITSAASRILASSGLEQIDV